MSIGGSVAARAAVLGRRIECVVVQSPSVRNGFHLRRTRLADITPTPG
ncbi:hypothetical protein [Microbispora triticiradicis]|nr:hypothetical protein [Microbispora triticiradicis]